MPLEISSKLSIIGFRVGFSITLIVVSYLALAPLDATDLGDSWDKGNHLAAFITLAFLLDFATSGYWMKWIAIFSYGLLIEIAQWLTEYRLFELADILADTIGIAIYVIIRTQLIRIPWLKTLRLTLDNP